MNSGSRQQDSPAARLKLTLKRNRQTGSGGVYAVCSAHPAVVAASVRQAREDGVGWEFWITADRFLHRMVRFLVGTMLDIARGRRPAADLDRLLTGTDNRLASPPAPPHGLFLVAVRYPPSRYLDPE